MKDCLHKVAALVILLGVSHCGPSDFDEAVTSRTFALSEGTLQVWTGWGDGQCIHAARNFFLQDRFGKADLGQMTSGKKDGCGSLGACKTWVDDTPDKHAFARHAITDGLQPFDAIVYKPTASNAFGHIGAVDHILSSGEACIVDSNWHLDEKSSLPNCHTVNLTPYGFYRLKSLEPK